MTTLACKHCRSSFSVSSREEEQYGTLGLPNPRLCPQDRLRRRLAFRNERNLFHRKCSGSGINIISFYPENEEFPVYSKDYWWSDKWDGKAFGRQVDFTRPFFEQYFSMRRLVPRMNMLLSHCENCDYSPYSVSSRDCYLAVSCVESEDVHYSYQTNQSRDCIDCALCMNCELCYECIYCTNCYDLRYSIRAQNSSNSWFLRDCIGCRNCFGCVNLRNQEYCFLNESLTKRDYQEKIAALNLDTRSGISRAEAMLIEFSAQFPTPYLFGAQNENVTGYHLHQSKNCNCCFDAQTLEDCSYIAPSPKRMKDCCDCNYSPNSELCVEVLSGVNGYDNKFIIHSWDIKNSTYCEECFYSNNLFGCVGLKHAQYCILNTQYSKDDFLALRNKLIIHMKETREWGEFFPETFSPFSYNQTVASDHFPLTKEEALSQGLRWREKNHLEYQHVPLKPPQRISETESSLCSKVLSCSSCEKNYKIQKSEFSFYLKSDLPIPENCPECRYTKRLRKRAPWKLVKRCCFKCGKNLLSALSTELAEKVACEECYLACLE